MHADKLVKKCIGSDYLAWNEFVRLYEGLVYRSVRCKLNRINAYAMQSDIHDIVQEIFIMLWEKNKLSMLRDIKRLKAWLVKVSTNSTVNYCRKVFKITKRTSSLDKTLTDDASYTLAAIIPCNKSNGLETIEAKEFQDILEREISKLNHKQRQAFKLNVYDCKKQRDIAEIMDIPAGTVSTLVSRAKRQVCEAVVKGGVR